MQFNKFISRSSSTPIIILLFSVVLLAVVGANDFEGASGDNLDPNVEPKQNHRNPKQFFSVLKSLLKQTQNKPQFQNPVPYQDPYYSQYPVSGMYAQAQQKIHTAGAGISDGSGISNPNYQSQYPMQNYQLQQHSSVPYYNENLQLQAQQQQQFLQQQQQQQLQLQQNAGGIGGFGGSPSSSSINPVLLSQGVNMLSKLGLGNLGLPEDLDLSTVANLINFGAFEGMLGRVNQFDKLQCIPRMICQMVAKRNEDQALRDSTSTTTSTTTTTERTRSTKKPKKRTRTESARFIKIGGVDTAVDQFVQFLDLMQLKDWSIYPYVKGLSEGNQAQRSGDCAQKFNTCPFSDDQLVYYFNNYNGGLFQSFRSARNLPDLNLDIIGNSTSSATNNSSTSSSNNTK